ncbi:MAG TPA: hypothetical protein VFM05_09015, partial [Candidatus Saccharimonadales bacterium]|nr:hypothetical protein [Candidatus Saccharimonadales bacterium]
MKKSLTERLDKKREAWVSRTSVLLDIEPNEVGQLLSIKRRQSLRLNPLKGAGSETIRKLQDIGWMGRQYAWMSEGYTIDSPIEIVRDSSLVAEGEVLIQNAASWLPVLALNPQTGEHILDVCAAPGGKTSHIAAITGNQAHVWANDSSKDRLLKMRTNLDRLGVAIER